jgi:hypothetical protein
VVQKKWLMRIEYVRWMRGVWCISHRCSRRTVSCRLIQGRYRPLSLWDGMLRWTRHRVRTIMTDGLGDNENEAGERR